MNHNINGCVWSSEKYGPFPIQVIWESASTFLSRDLNIMKGLVIIEIHHVMVKPTDVT